MMAAVVLSILLSRSSRSISQDRSGWGERGERKEGGERAVR